MLRWEAPDFACVEDGDVYWSRFLGFANAHLLTPAIYAAARDAAALPQLPPEARGYLAFIHSRNLRRNAMLRRQVLEIAGRLNASGEAPLLLKGAVSLFSPCHAHAGTRVIGDVDFLTDPNDGRIEAVLRDLGYVLDDTPAVLPHARGVWRRLGAAAEIDLHVSPTSEAYLLPPDAVRRCARVVRARGVHVLVPSPSHRLLHAFLHAQIHDRRHYYGIITLRELHEVAALSRLHGAEIRWDGIVRHLARHGLTTAFASYMLAAERLFGVPLPDAIVPSLLARAHHRYSLARLERGEPTRLVRALGAIASALARHHLIARHGPRNILALRVGQCLRVLRTYRLSEIRRKLS